MRRLFRRRAFAWSGCDIYTLGIILQICYTGADHCDLKSTKDRVMIAALLGIHENSPNCTEVSLRGMQELAILEKVVSHINENDGLREDLKIDLKMFDTCSTTEGVTRAILKALIMSKQTCASPPLLLGFIGPEDDKLLDAVQQISATFEKIHITSFAGEPYNRLKQENVYSVGIGRTKQRFKALLSVTNQLGWKSVVVITDDYHSSISLGNYMAEFGKDYLCVTNVVKITENERNPKIVFLRSIITDSMSNNSNNNKDNNTNGIIFIVEGDRILLSLSTVIRQLIAEDELANEMSFIVYASKVGLRPWSIPTNTFVLQEVSGKRSDNLEQFFNISLFGHYQKQLIRDYKTTNCGNAKHINAKVEEECLSSHINIPNIAFTEVIDSNIPPLEYAVHLLWSALKTARKHKCRSDGLSGVEAGICNRLLQIPLDEWKLYLQKTSLTTSDSTKRVSFNAEVPISVIVFVNLEDFNGLIQIGHITSNGSLYLEKPQSLPPIRKSKIINRCVQTLVKFDKPYISSTRSTSIRSNGKPITQTPTKVPPQNSNSFWFSLDNFWYRVDQFAEYIGQDWLESRFTVLGFGVIFSIVFFYVLKCICNLFKSESHDDHD